MKVWTRQELRLALALYCQLPFGRMHSRNPEIVALANSMGRTSSAVAMKLVNFASLDPQMMASGRKGLGNASSLDRVVWNEFQEDWERGLSAVLPDAEARIEWLPELADGETSGQRTVEVRLKQSLFRRVVMSSYNEACCMTGLSDLRLLVASHIVPWGVNTQQRLNPSNGLCLSALHDRAFDRGLLTVLPDLSIRVSSELKRQKGQAFARSALIELEGQKIRSPEKFFPQADFLRWHNETVFLD